MFKKELYNHFQEFPLVFLKFKFEQMIRDQMEFLKTKKQKNAKNSQNQADFNNQTQVSVTLFDAGTLCSIAKERMLCSPRYPIYTKKWDGKICWAEFTSAKSSNNRNYQNFQ